MKKHKKEILDYIKLIRNSFADAKIVYSLGACYGLYEILKERFPKSEAYMVDGNHVITNIKDEYYDIYGVFTISSDEEVELMKEEEHYIASSWKDGQRLEMMLYKYRESCKNT